MADKIRAAASGSAIAHDSAHMHVSGARHVHRRLPEPAGTLHAAFGTQHRSPRRVRPARSRAACARAPGVRRHPDRRGHPRRERLRPVVHDDPMLRRRAGRIRRPTAVRWLPRPRSSRRGAPRAGRGRVPSRCAPILDIEDGVWRSNPSSCRAADAAWRAGRGAGRHAHRLLGPAARSGGQDHFYLEGQIAIAIPGEDGACWCTAPRSIQARSSISSRKR